MQTNDRQDVHIRVDVDGSARLPASLCSMLGAQAGQTLRVWIAGDVIEVSAIEPDGSMRRFAHWRSISEELVANP